MDPEQLVFRPFSPTQDLPRLLSLVAEVEAADRTGMPGRESISHQLIEPGHDPQGDGWVVEKPANPAELIGWAAIEVSPETHTTNGNILVHPDWRRQGIGGKLVTRLIDRAGELQASVLRGYAGVGHAPAASFLQNNGFAAQGAYTELRLPAATRLPPVIWPFGYSMRPYAEVQDLATLTQAMNVSYIPLWGHPPVSEQEMAAWLPGFNQQGLFLVFSEKGRVVGISRAEPSPERTAKNGAPTGYIDAPGVVPQHRRLDLYRALVLTGIRWLYAQGQTIIEMESWGDKLEVLKMYRELGFEDLRQFICYQLELSKGGDVL